MGQSLRSKTFCCCEKPSVERFPPSQRENGGKTPWDGGPLVINPIYTLYTGYWACPLFKDLFKGYIATYHWEVPPFSLWPRFLGGKIAGFSRNRHRWEKRYMYLLIPVPWILWVKRYVWKWIKIGWDEFLMFLWVIIYQSHTVDAFSVCVEHTLTSLTVNYYDLTYQWNDISCWNTYCF